MLLPCPEQMGRLAALVLAVWLLVPLGPVYADGSRPGPDDVLVLEEGKAAYDLAPYVAAFIERTDTLGFDDLLAHHDALFTPVAGDLHFGMRSAPRWLRFRIVDRSGQDDWMLDVGYAALDEVRLYVPQADGGYRVLVGGDRVPASRRDHHTALPTFALPEAALDGRPLFLRVETSGHMDVPLRVVTAAHFFRKVTGIYLLHGLLVGVLLVVMLYNLFLYLSLRDRTYLFYVLYVGSTLLYMLSVTIITDQFFPPARPDGTSRVTLALIDATSLFALLFCRAFLDLAATQPRYDRFLRLFALLYVGEAFLLAAGSYGWAALLMALLGFVGPFVMLGAGIVAWRQGNRAARFYLIAWGLYLGIAVATGLTYAGVDLLGNLSALQTQYLLLGGASSEAVLLSLALADRIRQLQAGHEEEKQAMLKRIADDLHDDIGSRLSSVALQVEMAGHRAASTSVAQGVLQEVAGQARRLVDDLRDTVWLIDASHGTLPQLVDRVEQVAAQLLRGVPHRIQHPAAMPSHEVPATVRRNVLMIVKEALHNVVEHAGASYVEVRVTCRADTLAIHIKDDGCGFVPERVRSGRGSRTMAERAEQAGLDLAVDSVPDVGTEVRLAWQIV